MNKKPVLIFTIFFLGTYTFAQENVGEVKAQDNRPNILFVFADDWGRHAGAYDTKWLKTPNFDDVAKNGILFTEAYTASAKCAPSRASVMTGRYPWQNREIGNHLAVWPSEGFQTYIEALNENGYYVGFTGKSWGPGRFPANRQLAGKSYPEYIKDTRKRQYLSTFKDFIKDCPEGMPFHFWFGSRDPHRSYARQNHTDERLAQIDLPSYWKDTRERRADVGNYAFEVERFDSDFGEMIEHLKDVGLFDNTIIIVSSDNGMPFPRSKGDTYLPGSHLPMAAMWGTKTKNPGRICNQFITFVDIAPTILELANVKEEDTQMEMIQGRSFVDILKDEEPKFDRSYVLYGRERYDVNIRPENKGYPSRSIRKGDYLYIHNFKPDRVPTTSKESDIPAAWEEGTKEWDTFYALRPADELYNIKEDVECLKNLALNLSNADKVKALKEQLLTELLRHKDPRIIGGGDVFDLYPSSKNSSAKKPK